MSGHSIEVILLCILAAFVVAIIASFLTILWVRKKQREGKSK